MSDRAALAGWAQNPNVGVTERLAAAAQSLNEYVDLEDKLRDLLSHCEQNTRTPPQPLTGMATAYGDVADKLRAILDGE